MSPAARQNRALPKLPKLLDRKLYKTGQTRGADDDEIYQNRVLRNSTALIPYGSWERCRSFQFENGSIVLISPTEYFCRPTIEAELASKGLAVGTNSLLFYETREQWTANNPESRGWRPATSRRNPLGGQYVARIPATTSANDGQKIVRGFTATSQKGAGIRAYEYACAVDIEASRNQLEALYWLCGDSVEAAVANGMVQEAAIARKDAVVDRCSRRGLLDMTRLVRSRILSSSHRTICPLCLDELSAVGFFARMTQAEGREVVDLTITQLNLFHIEELRYGFLNHRAYNLGWGHHHCNVVVKDVGLQRTLVWMQQVLQRNHQAGYLAAENNPS